MRKPNYSYERQQREREQEAKAQAKQRKRADEKAAKGETDQAPGADDGGQAHQGDEG